MSELNKRWAIQQLEELQSLIKTFDEDDEDEDVLEEIRGQLYIVNEILDRVLHGWREVKYAVHPLEAASRGEFLLQERTIPKAIVALTREQELSQNLGDFAPQISAANLHPWVWESARSLWQSGHFRSAVEDALKNVNRKAQEKLNRRDVNETNLFQQAFSEDAPQPGKPRLRLMAADGSDTYKSLHRGARTLAEGIYAGIRNPFNHEAPTAVSEQVALEYLAALSVLARWVDKAKVEEAQ